MTQPNTLISVVIPTYNCGRFVDEAILSVLTQSYSASEVIVVDDGSTDDTVARVLRYGSDVRLIEQKNAGPATARNTGVSHARGEWLAFLDGDDVWLPDSLRARAEHLSARPELGAVYGRWHRWLPGTDGCFAPATSFVEPFDATRIEEQDSGWLYGRLLLDCIVWTSTVLLRKHVFQELGGFREGLRIGEDYDLWLRLSRKRPINKLSMGCALYRLHGANTTTQPPRLVNYPYEVVSGAVNSFGYTDSHGATVPRAAVESRLANLAFEFGREHFKRGDPEIALRAFHEARRHRSPSTRIAGYIALTRLRIAAQHVSRKILSQ